MEGSVFLSQQKGHLGKIDIFYYAKRMFSSVLEGSTSEISVGQATRPTVSFMHIMMAEGLISTIKKKHPFIYLSQKLTKSPLDFFSISISLKLRQRSLNDSPA